MAVKIRLKLTGKRNARTFRVIAIDESKKRNGRVIEELGFININSKPIQKIINAERLAYWQGKGAQMTSGAKKFIV